MPISERNSNPNSCKRPRVKVRRSGTPNSCKKPRVRVMVRVMVRVRVRVRRNGIPNSCTRPNSTVRQITAGSVLGDTTRLPPAAATWSTWFVDRVGVRVRARVRVRIRVRARVRVRRSLRVRSKSENRDGVVKAVEAWG